MSARHVPDELLDQLADLICIAEQRPDPQEVRCLPSARLGADGRPR